MENNVLDRSYTSTTSIYLQSLPLFLTLQMNQSFSARFQVLVVENAFVFRWLQMNDKNDK